ncbi:MAG: hypothetical protein EG826_05000 [Deltaproteobacteria bacterium]|nr:hypothetical protein [Deltaproteobacteria bacterium]
MYCEYWNLQKAPFDNVPDPSMYTDCHSSMEKVIPETIFAIKEADESFAVIIGTAGSGKTLSLRMIIDSLEPDKYKVVIITNPGISFTQLLMDIMSQITGQPCEESRKNVLLEKFRRVLLSTMGEGRKVVIFIDEANTLSPANLENLRLLTNIQEDNRNLFTLVLAGQMELAQRLEHPKRANLFQRIGTYGRIDKLPSEEALRAYVEARLRLAGTKIKIFSDDCIPILWEYSEHGVPRLVNKICKLCLKAGEVNHYDYISAGLVLEISERFQKLSATAVQKRKSRIRPTDNEVAQTKEAGSPAREEEPFSGNIAEVNDTEQEPAERVLHGMPCSETHDSSLLAQNPASEAIIEESEPEPVNPEPVPQVNADAGTIPESIPDKAIEATGSEPQLPERSSPDEENRLQIPVPVSDNVGDLTPLDNAPDLSLPAAETETQDTLLSEDPTPGETLSKDSKPSVAITSVAEIKRDHPEVKDHHETEHENSDEVIIGEHRIHLAIPQDILKQVRTFNRVSVNKSAGFWAAQIIKKNPQLTSSPLADPVYIWNEIRNSILKRIAV